MLINKSSVKKYALECASQRAKKFSRVSGDFYILMEGRLKEMIRLHIHTLPSVGKTIK